MHMDDDLRRLYGEDFFEHGVVHPITHTLDLAYGHHCTAKVARALGDKRLADELETRSRLWVNAFDPATGLLRDSEFYEGGKWNYSFRLLHDMRRADRPGRRRRRLRRACSTRSSASARAPVTQPGRRPAADRDGRRLRAQPVRGAEQRAGHGSAVGLPLRRPPGPHRRDRPRRADLAVRHRRRRPAGQRRLGRAELVVRLGVARAVPGRRAEPVPRQRAGVRPRRAAGRTAASSSSRPPGTARRPSARTASRRPRPPSTSSRRGSTDSPLETSYIRAADVHNGGVLHLELGPEPSPWGRSVRPPSLSDARTGRCDGMSVSAAPAGHRRPGRPGDLRPLRRGPQPRRGRADQRLRRRPAADLADRRRSRPPGCRSSRSTGCSPTAPGSPSSAPSPSATTGCRTGGTWPGSPAGWSSCSPSRCRPPACRCTWSPHANVVVDAVRRGPRGRLRPDVHTIAKAVGSDVTNVDPDLPARGAVRRRRRPAHHLPRARRGAWRSPSTRATQIVLAAEAVDRHCGTRFAPAVPRPGDGQLPADRHVRLRRPRPGARWTPRSPGAACERDGYVLFLSRVTRAKGVHDLVEAYAGVARAGPGQAGRSPAPARRWPRSGRWPRGRRPRSSSSPTSTTTRSRC